MRFWLSNLCMGLVYLVFFLFLFRWEKRQKMNPGKGQISVKELSGAIVIAVTAFFVRNFSFAFRDNVFSESLGEGILMVRTLVDFAGLILLYAHQEMRQESYLRFELEASDRLFQHQYEQYQLYRANHEQIRKIYHDLKHQVDVIRLETDQQKREKYLSEISKTLRVYETESQTGNPVLDTVLSGKRLQCEKQGIRIVVFVDAKKLGFMDVMDICSLFGNALDNAIESVSKLEDPEKRMVKVSVFSKNSFVLLQFENYFEDELKLTEGQPETTKKNAEMHGIGLKSMRAIAEKYGGNLTINMENHWFTVTLLLPIPQEEQV